MSLSYLRRLAPLLCVATLALTLSACASQSEEGRSEPIDMSQFSEGTDHFKVVSIIGEPTMKIAHEGRECDVYHLYTRGLGAGGKAAMKAAEVLTSIATLGVAQAVWAPINAGTHPNIHTVLFCFAQNDQLVDIFDKNPTNGSKPLHTIINQQLYSTPVIATAAPADSTTTPVAAAATTPTATDPNAEPAVIVAEPKAESPAPLAASEVDHVTIDPTTGRKTYYEKAATPKAAAPAGTISLDSVSQEAINGTHTVNTGRVQISSTADADDLNSISQQKAARANTPALGKALATNPPVPATDPNSAPDPSAVNPVGPAVIPQGSPDHMLHLPTGN